MSKVVHDTTEPVNQSANPWIQHFVPRAVGDVPYTSSDKVEANDIANQSILNSSMKEKAFSAKNPAERYSVFFQQNSAGSRIGSEVLQLFPEASDQNFVDMEHGLVGEQSKASNTKKRVRGLLTPCLTIK
ncbi:hypothetical protein HPP92_027215 [Vanilla planifolia]|uniref:Uncharacterized protein n=1 Tax=Vanilla planifolia TaxID=51239 RepID=A0A835U5W1_VANPL|nr:hypothetical protein HPP92_027215 [Vanilla planifolia]